MGTKNGPDKAAARGDPPRGEQPGGDKAREEKTGNKPVHEVRLGRIRAAIWENQTESNGTRHNVVFSRLYKDDENQWRDSTSFGRDDLLLVAKVANQVHTWIFERARASAPAGGSGSHGSP